MKNEEIAIKLAEMHKDICYIKNELNGNGKAGLIKRVDELVNFKWYVAGMFVVIGSILGLNVGGII